MKILHLEDNKRDALMMDDLLGSTWSDCDIRTVATRAEYLHEITNGEYDIVVSDYNLPGFNGLEALMLVKEHSPGLPFIFYSGTIGEERAIEAVRAGAADYVLKDRMQRLPIAIERVVRDAQALRARRAAEEALAKERYQMEILMKTIPDAVYFKDLDSRYLFVSKSVADSLGRTVEEMVGASSLDMFAPEFAEASRRDEERIIRTGEPIIRKEECVLWRDGRVSWALTTKLPFRDPEGNIIGTFGVSHDITERKQSEERIRELAGIIDRAPIAITISDLQRNITHCNTGAVLLYGMSGEELVGAPLSDVVVPETAERLIAIWMAAMEAGSWAGELPVSMKSGKRVHTQLHKWRITDSGGAPTGCLTIAIDITEKKKLEAQFLRSQRLEAIGTLSGGVAHDLNNVLAPIMMGVEMLRDEIPGHREIFDSILTSAKRGAELVKLLLAYAKGSEGVRMPISPERLLKELAQIMRGSFPKSIKLTVNCEPGLPTVLGDGTQLHQVLLNLCVNARDAMPDGGSLNLAASLREIDGALAVQLPELAPGKFVMLTVEDSGCGIPPEIMDRILDPFFSTKSPERGTGLGLSTVVGILKGHGGTLQVQSKVGEGSRFTVYLPVAEGRNEAPAAEEIGGELRGAGQRILFVDDEAAVRDVARAVMSRLNYRPLTAADGSDGLVQALVNRGNLDAIVADVHMPRLDGFAFVKMLRRMMPETPVMIVSGRLDDSEAEAFSQIGVTAHLTKPFTERQLAGKLHQLLAKKP